MYIFTSMRYFFALKKAKYTIEKSPNVASARTCGIKELQQNNIYVVLVKFPKVGKP